MILVGKFLTVTVLVLISVVLNVADAYIKMSPLATSTSKMRMAQPMSGLSKAGVIAATLAYFLSSSAPAIAAVGEGDLPDGAMAFMKIAKYQNDWKALAESVEKRKAEIDAKEIISIKFFLKQLANEYYDMEVFSSYIILVFNVLVTRCYSSSL